MCVAAEAKLFIWQATRHLEQTTGSPCPRDINTVQTLEQVKQEFDLQIGFGENHTQTGRLNPEKDLSRQLAKTNTCKYKRKGKKSRL